MEHKRKRTEVIKPAPPDPNWVLEYWRAIESGETVSRKVYKVYEGLAERINNPSGRWVFDNDRANHVVTFIERYCKHSRGKCGGKPFILELWQKAFISAAFGFVDKETGLRRYTEALLIVARKNGKSTLAAAIGLYLMIADGEAGAEIYSMATKKDQAKIIWEEAHRMIKKSPALKRRLKCLVGGIHAEAYDAVFKALSSDSDTLDGLNVHGGLIDELHAIKDKNIYDVIADGTAAREQPMIFITSTAGTVRENIYDEKYDDASKLIDGVEGFENERALAVIYELDKREEWTNPECWKKANPALGTVKNAAALTNRVKQAQANPLKVKNLLCKDFNIRETASEAWLTFEELNNEATFDVKALNPPPKYGIGGVDLSQSIDLTAAKVIFMIPDDSHIYTLQMYWLPEDLLEARTNEDKIPYNIWRDRGLLRTTEGNRVHARYVTEWFLEIQTKYGIYLPYIGYDAWSATYWVEEMAGYFGKQAMIPVRQGKKTLSSPMYALKADLAAKKIIYNNNPIDKWCLSNTVVDIDKNGNIQPSKGGKSRKRIDGTAALLDAYVILQDKLSDYVNII
jgi:phage terminase large subunit-like protein